MKKILTILFGLFLINNSNGQTYVPFPVDSAEWNCLFWHQWSANDIVLSNTSYLLKGDTLLKGKQYKKVHFVYSDFNVNPPQYIGGLREDENKNIYFFPSFYTVQGTPGIFVFPNDTSEHLLYTFNNLETGMVLPINEGMTVIRVEGIDSVLLGESYRKRYEIYQQGLFFNDYWIEGIGSIRDLLVPYSYEFEWQYYTLCFTDTVTYYINAPNGADSCHYSLPVGLTELEKDVFSVSPNPASNTVYIRNSGSKHILFLRIFNTMGQMVLQSKVLKSEDEINIKNLIPGVYIVEITLADRKQFTKLIKE